MIKKGAEKILKYKEHTFEVQHMWNATAKVIPVITGATGTISELPKLPEQRTGITRNEGTIENSHIHTRTHTHYRK